MSKGSCSFCGEHFDNVFEAVDHLGDGFDPKFVVSEHIRLGLGELLYRTYLGGNEETKKLSENLFAALYIAEKRPAMIEPLLMCPCGTHDLLGTVYKVVSQEAWKSLDLP